METAVQCRRRKIESRRSMRGALIEPHDPSGPKTVKFCFVGREDYNEDQASFVSHYSPGS
jgi:hypothetical protein